MIKVHPMLSRMLCCTRGTIAVETALVIPVFLTLAIGIADLGSGMFYSMTINAATQSGAIYAVANSSSTCGNEIATGVIGAGACLTGIHTAMNDAANDSSFCATSTCTARIVKDAACDGPNTTCIAVTANYPLNPILLSSYVWSQPFTITYTAKIRII